MIFLENFFSIFCWRGWGVAKPSIHENEYRLLRLRRFESYSLHNIFFLFLILPNFSFAQTPCQHSSNNYYYESNLFSQKADRWDLRANVCNNLSYHNIAEYYRQLSNQYKLLSQVCEYSPSYYSKTYSSLKEIKRNLLKYNPNTTLKMNINFYNKKYCDDFNILITTIDAY